MMQAVNQKFEQKPISICGAGPVGLATALFLVQRGVPASAICLIDAKNEDHVANDKRSIALSAGSIDLLRSICPQLFPYTPINQIHVSRQGYFGRTKLTKEDYQVEHLGVVARYADIVIALQRALHSHHVNCLRPFRCTATDEGDHSVLISLAGIEETRRLEVSMLIQAEGGIFSEQDARDVHRDYQQAALIAHVDCDRPQFGTAFERFTDQGPLALLPEDQGYSLVWCQRKENAIRRLALSERDFLSELQHAFGRRAGKFVSVGARVQFALGLNANSRHTKRMVAIGNAAQTLHPVAGQGLNLGLRDASVLAHTLAYAWHQQGTNWNLSTKEIIANYDERRTQDRRLTINLTDTLARIFTWEQHTALQCGMGLGLLTLDLFAPARHTLANQMMWGWRG